jgi:hypothetical protein
MINTSFLGNPKPSRGQDAPFAPRAGEGPSRTLRNAFGAAIKAPSLHNRAGILSNATITYPFLSRPWKQGEDKTLTEGALLFCYRDSQHSARNHGRQSYGMVVIADLAMINRKFSAASHKLEEQAAPVDRVKVAKRELYKRTCDSSFYSVFEDDALDPSKDKGAISEGGFLTSWSFVGVLRNESNPRGKLQRMLNADVRGRSRVRNIWGQVKGGDRLYVQLVRGKDRASDTPLVPEISEETKSKSWFLMPVVNALLPSKQIEFRSCCLIPIGTVTSAVCRESSQGARRRALYEGGRDAEGNMMVALDFIEIAVGVSCH